MITYTDTTIFNVNAQTIVNTVNCVGVMGAGLALECKLRYPEMYQDYLNYCENRRLKVGKPYVYRGYDHPWIMNFPTKDHWRYPSKMEWIRDGLEYFVTKYKEGGITSIAFPKLGCDKGGLDWNEVKLIMEEYLTDIDIDVYICLDREKEASGLEKVMIDLLNQTEKWQQKLKLKTNIYESILKALPLKRFRYLSKISGVGKETYDNMFTFLYSLALQVEPIIYKPTKAENLVQSELVLISQNQSVLEETKELINETQKEQVNQNKDITLESVKEDNIFEDWVLPQLEKILQIPQSFEQILEKFKTVNKKQMQDWLKLAIESGKIHKLDRPVKYISSSTLEYQFYSSKAKTNKSKIT